MHQGAYGVVRHHESIELLLHELGELAAEGDGRQSDFPAGDS
jgi:hypothetical protein